MFSKLRTRAITGILCMSALLAVPAALIVIMVMIAAEAKDDARANAPFVAAGRSACAEQVSSACMVPVPDGWLPPAKRRRLVDVQG
jgi:hypothetical protein